VKQKHGYRRGYSVAVLIGFEENRAVLWQVFSNVVKPLATMELMGMRKDEKALYNFHEDVVNALRPVLEEGVKSIVVAAPLRTTYAEQFLNHVRKHHAWLTQDSGSGMAVFGRLVGLAGTFSEVANLVKTKEFRKLISDTTSEEADRIVDVLEKRLTEIDSGTVVLYSLKEIEDLIYGQWKQSNLKPEYLMLTDKYLAEHKEKNRIHRLLQIAKNKNVKTRIVSAETAAGKRLNQFGGIICFTEEPNQ